ncbi:MAG: hypothetical protein ACKPKO_23810, partial [Candidatus Fonsibacter sp.]
LLVETDKAGKRLHVALYSLLHFATHAGGPHGGHYEAFVLRAGEWWVTSDISVSECDSQLPHGAGIEACAL